MCLENTHNRGAGRVQPYDDVAEICGWAAENGLARHLDGARLFNAVVATRHFGRRLGRPLRHGQRLLLEGPRRAGRLGACAARPT